MDILEEIIKTIEKKNDAVLCTIIRASGSTPASVSSKLLLKGEDSSWVGTVGGGKLEAEVLKEARKLCGTNTGKILSFTLDETQVEQGLICGGNVDILIEPLKRKDLTAFEKLKSVRDDGEDAAVATHLTKEGKVEWKQVVAETDDPPNKNIPEEELRKTLHRHETRRIQTAGGELILEPVTGRPSLVIFGGGHVSKFVSRFAAAVGFRVTVIDDREEYANTRRFPEAEKTLAVPFPDAFQQLAIKTSTYIVIVSRSHETDEEILGKALGTKANYIGMIGSKRKILTAYEHLIEHGVSLKSLQRVHAPIGIEIGASTPEEIGISVVAQMIAMRRGVESPFLDKAETLRDDLLAPARKIHFSE